VVLAVVGHVGSINDKVELLLSTQPCRESLER
jgi:hypothetical protein